MRASYRRPGNNNVGHCRVGRRHRFPCAILAQACWARQYLHRCVFFRVEHIKRSRIHFESKWQITRPAGAAELHGSNNHHMLTAEISALASDVVQVVELGHRAYIHRGRVKDDSRWTRERRIAIWHLRHLRCAGRDLRVAEQARDHEMRCLVAWSRPQLLPQARASERKGKENRRSPFHHFLHDSDPIDSVPLRLLEQATARRPSHETTTPGIPRCS